MTEISKRAAASEASDVTGSGIHCYDVVSPAMSLQDTRPPTARESSASVAEEESEFKRSQISFSEESSRDRTADSQEGSEAFAKNRARKRSILGHVFLSPKKEKDFAIGANSEGEPTSKLAARLTKPRKSLIERLGGLGTGESVWEKLGAAAGDLYTEESLVQRAGLRQDPTVVKALDTWWQTAQDKGHLVKEEGSEEPLLEHDQYVLMSKKLYRCAL